MFTRAESIGEAGRITTGSKGAWILDSKIASDENATECGRAGTGGRFEVDDDLRLVKLDGGRGARFVFEGHTQTESVRPRGREAGH